MAKALKTKRSSRGRSRSLQRTDVEIHVIRGEQVLLDSDLAAVYGVTTSALNQAVKRNPGRFPKGFRFRLTAKELADLRSRSVISSPSHGGRRTLPWAFTEHGAIMAAAVSEQPARGRDERLRGRAPSCVCATTPRPTPSSPASSPPWSPASPPTTRT